MILSTGSYFPVLGVCLYKPREGGLQSSWIFLIQLLSEVGLVQSPVKRGTCGGLYERMFTHCCAIKVSEDETPKSQ